VQRSIWIFTEAFIEKRYVCIIPSRYESSRFSGASPLSDLCGKPMIQHVYERVAKAKAVPYVAVATDDKESLTL